MAFRQCWDRFCDSKFRILSVVNWFLMTGIGIWGSVQYVMMTVDYSHHISSMDPPPFVDDDIDDEGKNEKSICLHADAHRDVLLHATYFLTSLVILYTLVEIFLNILLIRLVFNSRVTNTEYIETAHKFWCSYQILLIVLLVLTFWIFFPLKTHADTFETVSSVFQFLLIVSWKLFILIIYTCCYSQCGKRDKVHLPDRRKIAARARSMGWTEDENPVGF